MDFLQTIFSMINAPLFAVIFLGMFWKRSTGHGAFIGLLVGFLAALAHHGLTQPIGADTVFKGGWITVLHQYPVEMAQNFWTAIIACTVSTVLTIGISLMTKRNKSDDQLNGLVYALTPKLDDSDIAWYKRPWFLATIVGAICLILTIMFW